jgi:hypothetical protein
VPDVQYPGDASDEYTAVPEPEVGQHVLEQELALRVYDAEWKCRIYERVTGINLADNGLLVIQGNVIVNDRDANTGIAAYAPGAWQLYEIEGIEFRDVIS